MPRGIYIRDPLKSKYWLGKKRGPLTLDWKKKISDSEKGKKHTELSKKKMSLASMGKKGTYGNLGKKMSLENRIKQSEMRKGEKCHFWRGGVCKDNLLIRNSLEYKLWREKIFKRDNYTCQWCGNKSGNGKRVELNADHIKPFSLFPELRFELSNGRTLCKDCHSTTDSYLSNFKRNYNYILNKT